MDYHKIIQKAKLKQKINYLTQNFTYELSNSELLINKIKSLSLNKFEQDIFYSNALVNIVSFLNAFIDDLILEVVYSDPSVLQKKTVDFQTITTRNDYLDIVRHEAEKYINELSYKNIRDYFSELQKMGIKISNYELIENIAECIATRNIVIHNRGKINDLYLQNTKGKSRGEFESKIIVDYEYISNILKMCHEFSSHFINSIPQKYLNMNSGLTFKTMWNSVMISKTLKFDDAWDLEGDGSIYIKDEFINYLESNIFSHSELDLARFFLYIFNCKHEKSAIDLKLIHYHFNKNSNEYKMIHAWLEDPFYL